MSVFGNIFVVSDLEEAVINTLIKWFPTYAHEMEKELHLAHGEIVIPKGYTNRNQFQIQAAEALPRVVAISPGTIGTPKKTGQGKYSAVWRLGVGVVMAANNETKANHLVKLYGAIVRTILLQQTSDLGDSVIAIDWLSESSDDISVPAKSQLLKAASIYFAVEVDNVVTKGHGPIEPNQGSYDYGEVESVFVDLEKTPI